MKYRECWIYLIFMALANIGLLTDSVAANLYYYPDLVFNGEIHRLFTHAFVHVSWYHLLLDGSAFIMLYNIIEEPSIYKRSLYVLGANISCVIGVTWILPFYDSIGFCGLSGIDHGLMTIWALQVIRQKDKAVSRIGQITFITVLAKALYEAVSKHVFFDFMHANLMGQPVTISHISGIAGAILLFIILTPLTNSLT